MAVPGGPLETLDSVPPHVWKGLPEEMSLKPSAISQNRIGVWATRLIPKGKRFGPFVGERKKRSQVTSNVYMWEVYFPAWGWMCVDATDPMKGNWLRYVNWARSTEEQNLFPLEINRAIYYKVLKPIEAGEELLVWYNGEDNPEIAAAIEEERTSSLCRKNSPRAKRARRKLLERARARARARQSGLGGFRGLKQACGSKATGAEMRDSDSGPKEEGDGPSPSLELLSQDKSLTQVPSLNASEYSPNATSVTLDEDQNSGQMQPDSPLKSRTSSPVDIKPTRADEHLDMESLSPDEESPGMSEKDAVSVSSLPKPELDPDPDPEGGDRGDLHFSCQHCERHFATKQGLERHTHIHVTANHQIHTFKCRYCNKSFGSQIGCRRHERRHENGSKKRQGSFSSPAAPSVAAISSSPDLVSSGQFKFLNAKTIAEPHESSDTEKQSKEIEQTVVDGNKELHPCKYCKKTFGTHTNMRRHQRRIHERHLLPKVVRRKDMLMQEGQPQQEQPALPPQESPSTSPPLVYLPSGDAEDEGAQEDYMIDISSNISENLSLYIDGKILSTSTVSTCEVIEVDSSSASLFGLDNMMVNPDKITHAVTVETAACTIKDIPNSVQIATKRRTSTPPLVPKIKSKSESSSVTSSTASSSSSSASSVVGGVFPQATETLAFQKEKTVYLSPKLKQLLQTQDTQKPTLPLPPETHRLISPTMSVTTLTTGSGRFKRRTASPPNSPQLSPGQKGESSKTENAATFAVKVPKQESVCRSPGWSLSGKSERDTMSPSGVDAFKASALHWSPARSGGSSCNQQPLDLSSAVSKRNDNLNRGPGEAVLDLSVHRKSSVEAEVKVTQPVAKKRKPNTSMLEKVLMNEYAGLDSTLEEVPGIIGSSRIVSGTGTTIRSSDTSCTNPEGLQSESALHPPPPSLTPVTMNPPSPQTPTLASPTPPPPVLPTVPSPLPLSSSPNTHPSGSSALCSLPVLSPKTSPRPVEFSLEDPSIESDSNPERLQPQLRAFNTAVRDTDFITKSLNPKSDSEYEESTGMITSSADSSVQFETLPPFTLGLTVTTEKDPQSSYSNAVATEASKTVGQAATGGYGLVEASSNHSFTLLRKMECHEESVLPSAPHTGDPPVLDASLSLRESPLTPSSLPAVISESPPPLVLPPTLVSAVIKEEPQHKEEPTETSINPSGAVSERAFDEESCELETFCKNFVCNVCEQVFSSIKELSRHITEHASEWPFKCEFCVQLFQNATALLEHRSALHGVGRIYICCACNKEFAFLCNLQQHQTDLHPGQDCTHTVVENGKLRPQNYNDPSRANMVYSPSATSCESLADGTSQVHTGGQNDKCEVEEDEEGELDDSSEELYTTIKIMASEGGKPKDPDVRLGINQHYPSFKPPPFPYHNRTPAGSVTSATNFTTHNIPQTFSTAIRCTKCGKSFDNMPELHKHILACANASDKKRYTPKKNPVPLKQIAKPQNGAVLPVMAISQGQNALRRTGQPKRLSFSQEPSSKVKLSVLNKKKNQLVQKAISQRNRSSAIAKNEQQENHVCPHCNREFTYLGSLNKHVTVSCPMKPVSKKAKKSGTEPVTVQDKNANLRRRTADTEIKQQRSNTVRKPLGKTRAQSSGPTDASSLPLKPLPGRGKMADLQVRPKRPAALQPASVLLGKKSKKDSTLQHSPSLTFPNSSAQRPGMRMQRGGKEPPLRKMEDMKPQQQSKKEERFSLKTRERVGGPVTRSVQLATVTSQVEVKAEDLSSQQTRESQETLLKLAR